MKNMVWHGQFCDCTIKKQGRIWKFADAAEFTPDYLTGSMGIEVAGERCNVHIDELEDALERYRARI